MLTPILRLGQLGQPDSSSACPARPLTKLGSAGTVFVTLAEIFSLSKLYDLVSFVMQFFYQKSNSYMIVISDSSFCLNFFFFSNQTLTSRLLSPSTLLFRGGAGAPLPRGPLLGGEVGTHDNNELRHSLHIDTVDIHELLWNWNKNGLLQDEEQVEELFKKTSGSQLTGWENERVDKDV
jgi:hypothetical protein